MAIKTNKGNEKEMRTTDVENAKNVETQDGDGTSVDASAPAEPSPRRRGGPRGPRGPVKPWDPNPDVMHARDAALVGVLKSEKGNGSVRTATSIAAHLASHPAFSGFTLTSAKIKARVSYLQSWLESQEKAIPAWLSLDGGRTKSKPDMSLFEG